MKSVGISFREAFSSFTDTGSPSILAHHLFTCEDHLLNLPGYGICLGHLVSLYTDNPGPFPWSHCAYSSSNAILTCVAFAWLKLPNALAAMLLHIFSWIGSCDISGTRHSADLCPCTPHLKHSPEHIMALPGQSGNWVFSVTLPVCPCFANHCFSWSSYADHPTVVSGWWTMSLIWLCMRSHSSWVSGWH